MKKEVWVKLVKRIGNWIEYLFLFLCGFCSLDGITGLLLDFFQDPFKLDGTGLTFGR